MGQISSLVSLLQWQWVDSEFEPDMSFSFIVPSTYLQVAAAFSGFRSLMYTFFPTHVAEVKIDPIA